MLANGVYRLKQDVTVSGDLKFKSSQEFEIVQNVVYMGGFPISREVQSLIFNWMDKNQTLFQTDNRH